MNGERAHFHEGVSACTRARKIKTAAELGNFSLTFECSKKRADESERGGGGCNFEKRARVGKCGDFEVKCWLGGVCVCDGGIDCRDLLYVGA